MNDEAVHQVGQEHQQLLGQDQLICFCSDRASSDRATGAYYAVTGESDKLQWAVTTSRVSFRLGGQPV